MPFEEWLAQAWAYAKSETGMSDQDLADAFDFSDPWWETEFANGRDPEQAVHSRSV
jgi:hypothetical protein